jgi:hypothetical protein
MQNVPDITISVVYKFKMPNALAVSNILSQKVPPARWPKNNNIKTCLMCLTLTISRVKKYNLPKSPKSNGKKTNKKRA